MDTKACPRCGKQVHFLFSSKLLKGMQCDACNKKDVKEFQDFCKTSDALKHLRSIGYICIDTEGMPDWKREAIEAEVELV